MAADGAEATRDRVHATNAKPSPLSPLRGESTEVTGQVSPSKPGSREHASSEILDSLLPVPEETDARSGDGAEGPHLHPWPRRAGINAFSALLAVGTALLLWVGPLGGLGPVRLLTNEVGVLLFLSVAFAATAVATVSFHYRGGTYHFGLVEVPLLLGFVFASPRFLVLSLIAGLLAVFGAGHRYAPTRLLITVTSSVFAAAVADTVFRELLGSHSPVGFVGWGAGAAGLAAGNLTASQVVRMFMRLQGHKAHREFLTESLLLTASIGLAFVVLDAAWWDIWAAVPLVLVGGAILFAYRGYNRLSLRFAALERLYDFSRSLGTANAEPAGMTLAVLQQVRKVMRARRAEIILAEPSGIPRRVSLDPLAGSKVEPLVLDESSMVARAISTQTAALHSRQKVSEDEAANDSIFGEYREALVAPLLDGSSTVGALVALDREEEEDPFDTDDLRLFEALAVHASASLDRARLVEELRFEVDSKSHQATHDTLTGLANRTLFLQRASQTLAESNGMAIALLDIDRFKDVNDTVGHAIGDRLLCEVSERLVRAVSGRATVARLGGDEFALVLPDVNDSEKATTMISEINAELGKPIEMDGLTFAVTTSVGIAIGPEHGDGVPLLLQRADIAMYQAKERRSGIEVYSVGRDQSMQRRLMLGGLLMQAIETGDQFSLMYQPIVDLSSGKVVRVEALARWQHPLHGWIPTPEFIEIAQQMGIISQISDYVLKEACATLAEWRSAGLDIGLDVNISGRELSDDELVERVARHLRANHLPGEALTIELTETEIMADLGRASSVLNHLSELGVRISIDDYGTGYSSLAYLHRLPVNELKIDRSFVTNLAEDPSNAIIVRSSIAMAHSLGLVVVAEGAEDQITIDMLAEAGCDSVQGYYLSWPQDPFKLTDWLLNGERS